MRFQLTFGYSTEYIHAEGDEGILGIRGVQWFIEMLRRVPGLEIKDNLLQEDWGVVIYISREVKKFWVGIGCYGIDEWYVHFHHDDFFRQRFSKTGKEALQSLILNFHQFLARDSSISKITWYKNSNRGMVRASGRSDPSED